MKTVDYSEISRMYERKRNLFVEALAGSSWRALPCAGTYFQVLDYSEISNESDFDFAVKLNKEAKVTSIPLSPFYENGSTEKRLRFCFAKEDHELLEAANRLKAYLEIGIKPSVFQL